MLTAVFLFFEFLILSTDKIKTESKNVCLVEICMAL